MKNIFFVFCVLTLFLSACDSSRVFEDYKNLPNAIWDKNANLEFDFDIKDTNKTYNLYFNIRNKVGYPHYNLYVQYQLLDEKGNVLIKKTEEGLLFDALTGEPYGEGLGDLFDHQILFLKDYQFKNAGKYRLVLQQYMRINQLQDVSAVGMRVEFSEKDEK